MISIIPEPDHFRPSKANHGLELQFLFTWESIKPGGFRQLSGSDPRQKPLLETVLESSRSKNNQEPGGLECFSKALNSNLGTPNNRRAFQNHSLLGLEHRSFFTSIQSGRDDFLINVLLRLALGPRYDYIGSLRGQASNPEPPNPNSKWVSHHFKKLGPLRKQSLTQRPPKGSGKQIGSHSK